MSWQELIIQSTPCRVLPLPIGIFLFAFRPIATMNRRQNKKGERTKPDAELRRALSTVNGDDVRLSAD